MPSSRFNTTFILSHPPPSLIYMPPPPPRSDVSLISSWKLDVLPSPQTSLTSRSPLTKLDVSPQVKCVTLHMLDTPPNKSNVSRPPQSWLCHPSQVRRPLKVGCFPPSTNSDISPPSPAGQHGKCLTTCAFLANIWFVFIHR